MARQQRRRQQLVRGQRMARRQDRRRSASGSLHTVTAVSSIGSSAMPMSKLSLGRSWLTTSEWREIRRTDTPGRSLRNSATSGGSSEIAAARMAGDHQPARLAFADLRGGRRRGDRPRPARASPRHRTACPRTSASAGRPSARTAGSRPSPRAWRSAPDTAGWVMPMAPGPRPSPSGGRRRRGTLRAGLTSIDAITLLYRSF